MFPEHRASANIAQNNSAARSSDFRHAMGVDALYPKGRLMAPTQTSGDVCLRTLSGANWTSTRPDPCEKSNFSRDFNQIRLFVNRRKISLPFYRKICSSPAVPTHKRGASRPSRALSRECDGRIHIAGRAIWMRTTEACGPGTPGLVLSLAGDPRGDGD